MGRVLRKLQAQHGVMYNPHPTMRHYPRTKPILSWNMALNFYIQDSSSRTGHVSFLMPNFMDFEKVDGTYSSQHIVMFSNMDDYSFNEMAAEVLANAYVQAYTS